MYMIINNLKTRTLIIFLLAGTIVLTTTMAQAQSASKSTRIGLRLGGNINKVVTSYEGKSESGDGSLDFHAMLTADFRLINNLYLSTGAGFITKGDGSDYHDEWEGKRYRSITSLSYIEVPLLASYVFPVSKKFRVRADVGPYVAYGLFGKSVSKKVSSSGLLAGIFEKGEDYGDPFKKDEDDDYAACKRLDYGLRFGGAFELGKFTVGASYDLGLANILDGPSEYFSHHNIKSSTRALLVSIGLNF